MTSLWRECQIHLHLSCYVVCMLKVAQTNQDVYEDAQDSNNSIYMPCIVRFFTVQKASFMLGGCIIQANTELQRTVH